MATAAQTLEIYRYTVGLFQAAPGAYIDMLEDFVDAGNTTQEMATVLAYSPLFNALYPTTVSNEQFVSTFLDNLVGDTLDADTMTLAEDTLVGLLDDGAGRGEVVVAAIDFVATVDADDAMFGAARQQLDDQIMAVRGYQLMPSGGELSFDLQTLQNIVDPSAGMDILLTNGFDDVTGSSSADLFTAYIYDNANSFESGDMIDGGDGVDTLVAHVGNSQNFAISAITENLENVFFRAQAQPGASEDAADNDVFTEDFVQIDAQYMEDVEQFWSLDSRADLTIEDVRVNSNETTIGWRNADTGDVDFHVHFDNQHITDAGTQDTGGSLILTLADLDNMDDGGSQFTEDFPYDILTVNFAGVDYELDIDYTGVETADDLAVAINAAFAADGVDSLFTAVATGQVDVNHPDTLNELTIDQIVIEKVDATLPGDFDGSLSSWDNSGAIPGDTAYYTRVSDEQAIEQISLTQTNIILDNVGRSCAAGDLIIGSMSISTCPGIEQFNMMVDRDSWIDELASTNDTLEVVNVVNISDNNADGDGDLRIEQLDDVRVFDASEMDGDVRLTATLTDAVGAKYLDATDDDSDQSDDNSDAIDYLDVVDNFFSYDFGNGDDTLSLSISDDNVYTVGDGTGNVTREDFELEVNGGEGDDSLTLTVVPATANGTSNQNQNANLVINGDEGDDVIKTQDGNADFEINGGSGDDVIRVDDSGSYAQWVVNATNAELSGLADLEGAGNGTNSILEGATLTVTFSGSLAEQAGIIRGDAAEDDLGFETVAVTVTNDYVGNQTTINQAIKAAINNDDVVSQFLVATDGPADTIIITALVDGVYNTEDIYVNVTAQTLPSTFDDLDDAYEDLINDSTADLTQTIMNNYANAFDGNVAVLQVQGAASAFESDNEINVGSGDDVVVLGSGVNSNDTLVFDGTGLGSVAVFNFDDDTTTTSTDSLDFSFFLDGLVSASGSTNSQVAIADTYEVLAGSNTADVDADEIIVINGFTSAVNESWADMTAADLLLAIQDDDDSVDYGSITDATDPAAEPANFVGTTMEHIFMVENDLNDGEYKVFTVQSDTDSGEFTAATLITEIDFGDTLNWAANAPGTGFTFTAGAAGVFAGTVANDTFVMGAFMDGSTVNGGDGTDTITFTDDGGTATDLDLVTNVEVVTVGDAATTVTTVDALVAAGESLTFNAGALTVNALTFDGSAETNGDLVVIGGDSDDTITGGAGDDTITGGVGADTLTGGAGANTFVYDAADSGVTTATADIIADFVTAVDSLELGTAGTAANFFELDADTGAGDQIATVELAVAAADAAAGAGTSFDGTVQFMFVFDSVAGVDGYLVADNDLDGTADFAIELTGLNVTADVVFGDIVA